MHKHRADSIIFSIDQKLAKKTKAGFCKRPCGKPWAQWRDCKFDSITLSSVNSKLRNITHQVDSSFGSKLSNYIFEPNENFTNLAADELAD